MQRALHGRRDRAGVRHVLTQITPRIDAADHQVRPLGQNVVETQKHRVRWRAGNRVVPLAMAVEAQRDVQADRLAGGAHLLVGSDYRHFTHRRQTLLQGFDSYGANSVVVRDENAFQGVLSVISGQLSGVSYQLSAVN